MVICLRRTSTLGFFGLFNVTNAAHPTTIDCAAAPAPQIMSVQQAKNSGKLNRWNCVWIQCVQHGQPRVRERVANEESRRKTSSSKVIPTDSIFLNMR